MNLTCEVTKDYLDLLCSPGPAVNPMEALSQEVRGRNMMEAAGPQEIHRVHSRFARRPDTSGSHSRPISDEVSHMGIKGGLSLVNHLVD